MDMVKFVIFGAIVGVANIIPGVSGGTMAVILKIYDRLIETLSLKNVKKNLPFIIPLGIGAAVGIVLFSSTVIRILRRKSFSVCPHILFAIQCDSQGYHGTVSTTPDVCIGQITSFHSM